MAEKSPSKWANLIVERHKMSEHVRGRWEPQKVKDNVVANARFHWALLFSRFFAIMPLGADSEALFSGKNEGIIAINFNGVVFIDQNENPLMRTTFMEISGVSVNRNLDDVAIAFVITTVRGKGII